MFLHTGIEVLIPKRSQSVVFAILKECLVHAHVEYVELDFWTSFHLLHGEEEPA